MSTSHKPYTQNDADADREGLRQKPQTAGTRSTQEWVALEIKAGAVARTLLAEDRVLRRRCTRGKLEEASLGLTKHLPYK